jgi:hypothetical protein
MRSKDTLDMQGRLTIHISDAAGRIVEKVVAPNSIVLTGRDLVAKMFINEKIDPVSHLAVGTNNTAVDPPNDKALGAEVARAPLKQILADQALTTVSSDDGKDKRKKITLTAELNLDQGNATLTEAGLFNAAKDGVMYNRIVFPGPIQKTKDFKLTFIWELTF